MIAMAENEYDSVLETLVEVFEASLNVQNEDNLNLVDIAIKR